MNKREKLNENEKALREWLLGKEITQNVYAIPLFILKRMSDVFDDEMEELAAQVGGIERAQELVAQNHGRVHLYVPPHAHWETIQHLQKDRLGEYLNEAVRGVAQCHPILDGIINAFDFTRTENGERVVSDESLRRLVEILSQYRIGLRDVEPAVLAKVYKRLVDAFWVGTSELSEPWMVRFLIGRLDESILNNVLSDIRALIAKGGIMPSLTSLRRNVPKLYEQMGARDPIVYARVFPPGSRPVLYVMEIGMNQKIGEEILFALGVKDGRFRLGYWKMADLLGAQGPRAERTVVDPNWEPKPLSQTLQTIVKEYLTCQELAKCISLNLEEQTWDLEYYDDLDPFDDIGFDERE